MMLTTFHEDRIVALDKVDFKTKEPIQKPAVVVDYNENMGAIDRSDMMLSSTECVRKFTKWYKKLFFHIVDLSLLKAHALYLTQSSARLPLADYQLTIIGALFDGYKHEKNRSLNPSTKNPQRLKGRHFPSSVLDKKVK
nr:piggyBac transposable element-derived protein 4-like [Leptinotarsa decemlineata]